MPTPSIGSTVLERNPSLKEMERRLQGKSSMNKNLQRVYPLGGMHRSSSSLTLSSLSLSQNSNDSSSLSSSISSWDHKFPVSLSKIFSSWERREFSVSGVGKDQFDSVDDVGEVELGCRDPGSLKRCNWITKTSDEIYVSFHDECWGVPVFNDNRLFELLTLAGLLIDHNWTETLKRRESYREVFSNFDHNVVAMMEEKDISEISSNKELALVECRVRCIIENARCIQKVAKEFGSFSGYIWGHMNHRPMVNKYKHLRSIPLRTPKSEAISKDLVRRGFRLAGPVIVYSFMQAAGMVIDHLIDCFRFGECVKLAQRSWGITNMGM